ncbi:hypothetical protein [Streptomyces sp. NPDC088726]|uniref:hypothetical protein n=1 Tax=Streptomyces sp. NPDC088726 TaxID=3365874 RepID=UPI00382B2A32
MELREVLTGNGPLFETTRGIIVAVMEKTDIQSRTGQRTGISEHGHYQGWGEVVLFAACTAARIGEVAGCRVGDIDTTQRYLHPTSTESPPPEPRSPHTSPPSRAPHPLPRPIAMTR